MKYISKDIINIIYKYLPLIHYYNVEFHTNKIICETIKDIDNFIDKQLNILYDFDYERKDYISYMNDKYNTDVITWKLYKIDNKKFLDGYEYIVNVEYHFLAYTYLGEETQSFFIKAYKYDNYF
jgi:hypothetical protein